MGLRESFYCGLFPYFLIASQSGHVAVHIALLVDCQVVCCAHIVGRMDGLGTEAQVADGHATALLGIVLEVGLDVTDTGLTTRICGGNHQNESKASQICVYS